MPNYRYSTMAGDFILTEVEHEAIQAARKDGKTQFSLRGGTIGFTLSGVSWRPTEKLTDAQMLAGNSYPRLPSGPLPKADRKEMAETHNKLWDRWGKKHGKECPDWCAKKADNFKKTK